ncbi:pilus assembly PilX N-terminal domain-containing protein [Halarsenatibacter silvermanii]|uniref:Uncharacterized protein n=1 Tax=Halarsenatibacter silvermanii TaxID=321763 RepID=A0A1G9LCC6_9FIRM|nr:pilus assembly PilX N-terminal domain-containing protein [Halarsenatibacter silvermanii]SDL59632.1 hypothetical protein SAMN04488692_10623 [Halarsenatibacter silvermanii]
MFRNNEKGIALIMVLIMLAVVGVLAAMLLSSARTHSNIAMHEENMSKAFHSAEAGVEFVKANISDVVVAANEINDVNDGDYYLAFDGDEIVFDYINSGEGHVSDEEDKWRRSDIFALLEDINDIDDFDIDFKIEVLDNDGDIKLLSTGRYFTGDNNNYYKEEIEFELAYAAGAGSGGFLGITGNDEVYLIGPDTDWKNFGDETPILEEGKFQGNIYGGAWDGNNLLLAGDVAGGNNIFFNDALTKDAWEAEHFKSDGANHIKDIIYCEDSERFYNINHNGRIHEAYFDGTEWQNNVLHNEPGLNLGNVRSTLGQDKLVFVERGGGGTNTVYTYDINNDEFHEFNPSYFEDANDVAYGKDDKIDRFVAVGYEGKTGEIYYSDNGEDWHLATDTGWGWEIEAVTWTGKRFVAVGHSGHIATSTDGKVWDESERVTVPYTRKLTNVTGDGDFVIASSQDPYYEGVGTINVSFDGGINWDGYDGSVYGDIPDFKDIISVGKGSGSPEPYLSSWKQL